MYSVCLPSKHKYGLSSASWKSVIRSIFVANGGCNEDQPIYKDDFKVQQSEKNHMISIVEKIKGAKNSNIEEVHIGKIWNKAKSFPILLPFPCYGQNDSSFARALD